MDESILRFPGAFEVFKGLYLPCPLGGMGEVSYGAGSRESEGPPRTSRETDVKKSSDSPKVPRPGSVAGTRARPHHEVLLGQTRKNSARSQEAPRLQKGRRAGAGPTAAPGQSLLFRVSSVTGVRPATPSSQA